MASGFPQSTGLERARQKNMMALLRPYLENYITPDILYLLMQKLTQVHWKETETLPSNGRDIKITVRREWKLEGAVTAIFGKHDFPQAGTVFPLSFIFLCLTVTNMNRYPISNFQIEWLLVYICIFPFELVRNMLFKILTYFFIIVIEKMRYTSGTDSSSKTHEEYLSIFLWQVY